MNGNKNLSRISGDLFKGLNKGSHLSRYQKKLKWYQNFFKKYLI